MTRRRAVFDASVVVRALVDQEPTAADWVRRVETREIDAVVPDLLYAECANAFAGYVRNRGMPVGVALDAMEIVRDLRFAALTLDSIAGAALAVALERDVSVNDGCYLALAEAEGVVLVTADQRLAAATTDVEVIP